MRPIFELITEYADEMIKQSAKMISGKKSIELELKHLQNLQMM